MELASRLGGRTAGENRFWGEDVQAYRYSWSPVAMRAGRCGSSRRSVAGAGARAAALVATLAGIWREFLVPSVLCPLGCVALTTGVLLLAASYAAVEVDLVVYLVPVVCSAVRWGRAAAFTAVAGSAAVADFLLIPPFYSFVINDPRQIVELALFVFVALVTSHLAARLRSHVDALQRREHEIDNLYAFSRRLAACTTAADVLSAIEDHVGVRIGARVRLLVLADFLPDRDDGARVPREVAAEAQAMVTAADPGARVVACGGRSRWALKCIATAVTGHGVLAVRLEGGAGHGGPDRRSEALLSDANAMLTRLDATAALAKANMRLESEFLQAALIDTATHELRSPVAAILGSASVLDQVPALRDNEKLHSLVVGMHHEAERLDSDIRNLLDTVRITDSAIRPNTRVTDVADVVATAIRHRHRRTAAHQVAVDVAADVPLLSVDPVLIEQALGQVIENAAKYSPAGSRIGVAVGVDDGDVVVSVTDGGIGLTPEETANLFRRAWRGRRHAARVPGLGLGLWIARIFVAAHGGTLTAHSEGPGRGTTMTIRLPLGPPAHPIEKRQFEPV